MRNSKKTQRLYLNSYQIIATLGQGGMGRVYLVQDREGKSLAAKVLDISQEEIPLEYLKRFEQECKILAKLDSPNIVKPYGMMQKDEDTYFYVMEYVPGKNLQQLLRTHGRLSPELATYYMIQLLKALEIAHQKNVIHRDIKASNLIINQDGILKVTDFGIAFEMDATHFTQTGKFLGTPYAISPEQARGDEAVPLSDVYSVGIVFYETLTGEPPFTGRNALSLLYQHQEKEAPSLKEKLPDVPDELDQFLQRCLKKTPEERFTSTKAARLQLEKIFQEYPVSLDDVQESTQLMGKRSILEIDPAKTDLTLAKEAKKKKLLLVGLGFLLLLFLSFLSYHLLQSSNDLLPLIQVKFKDKTIKKLNFMGIKGETVRFLDPNKVEQTFNFQAIDTFVDLKNKLRLIEIIFKERSLGKKRVKLLGIEKGILHYLNSTNKLEQLPSQEILEFTYVEKPEK